MSFNQNLVDVLSIIEQAKIRPNLQLTSVYKCPLISKEQKVALEKAMDLPRKLICNLLALRSAQEVKRLAPYSAMKRFPKDLLRVLGNFLK